MTRWYSHRAEHPERLPAKNVGNDVLYQIFVDRFAAGPVSKQGLNGGRFSDPSRRDPFRFWGGDLRGIIEQLPYLKGLGLTRLWLTPIFENLMVTIKRRIQDKDIEMTPYHGYWLRDWFRLNPYFTDKGVEDFAILDELIAKAGPDLKILLDTVVNHTSPTDPTPESLARLATEEQLTNPGASHLGAFFRRGGYVASIAEDRRRHAEGKATRFHHFGPIKNFDDEFERENHQLDGLADLNQDDPVVEEYLRDAHAFWMERFPGLAGYRMDTVKHVNHAYWRRFDREFFDRFPDKQIVGEYFDGGPNHTLAAKYYRETRMTMFDFQFRHALVDVFIKGQSAQRFGELWAKDPELVDATALVTFADNHDLPRLRGLGLSLAGMKQVLALLFVARGVPCVYYGLEQDLFHPGDPGDPYCRQMMPAFDASHELYRLTATMAKLRKENLSLRHGRTQVLQESDQTLAIERVHEDRVVLLALSLRDDGSNEPLNLAGLSLADGDHVDLLSGRQYAIRRGKLEAKVGPRGIVLLAT